MLEVRMNELQEAIYQVIINIFKNEFLTKKFKIHDEYRGQKIIENSAIRYGILNYVAKYSLANDEYFISEKCFEYLDAPVVRSASLDIPIPFSSVLEECFLPKQRFERKLKDLLNY